MVPAPSARQRPPGVAVVCASPEWYFGLSAAAQIPVPAARFTPPARPSARNSSVAQPPAVRAVWQSAASPMLQKRKFRQVLKAAPAASEAQRYQICSGIERLRLFSARASRAVSITRMRRSFQFVSSESSSSRQRKCWCFLRRRQRRPAPASLFRLGQRCSCRQKTRQQAKPVSQHSSAAGNEIGTPRTASPVSAAGK
jgi:hypothetical protein